MPLYYKVKPEFDGEIIMYYVSDKRKRTGWRFEEIELVGCELISPKTYEKIISNKPHYSDIFEEVRVNIYSVYRSFGVLFDIKDCGTDWTEYISEKKKLTTQLRFYYQKARHKEADSRITRWLSIETLKEAINYYISLTEAHSG